MKAVIQRVLSAAVEAEGERIASVGRGFLLLLGVTKLFDSSIKAYIRRHKAMKRDIRFSLPGWRKKRRSCGSSRMKRAG